VHHHTSPEAYNQMPRQKREYESTVPPPG